MRDRFQRLVERIDPTWRVVKTWSLLGGVSAQVTGVIVERDDAGPLALVVRQHGAIDRAGNPHIARDEHRLLTVARAHGLRCPEPYYVDERCDLFEHPVIVVGYVEGETVFEPDDPERYVAALTDELARIHSVRDREALAFLPDVGRGYRKPRGPLDESMGEGRIRDALATVGSPPAANAPGLLHGDYWPGNLLWRNAELAAVIDWEDARWGEPLSDIAITRMELLFALGEAAMDAFTQRYVAATGVDATGLAYWDLCAAVRPCGQLGTWGLSEDDERRMRERHAWFVERAIRDMRP